MYYPWINENKLISGFKTYEDSYKHKQYLIQEAANKFNEDCALFDESIDDIENDMMQSAWNLVALLIAQDDAITSFEVCSTLQQHSYEHSTHGITTDDSSGTKDILSKLYEKAAKKQFMHFQDYCKKVQSLNDEQRHMVMFNRAWCKKYVHSLRCGSTITGYRVFLSGRGGSGVLLSEPSAQC